MSAYYTSEAWLAFFFFVFGGSSRETIRKVAMCVLLFINIGLICQHLLFQFPFEVLIVIISIIIILVFFYGPTERTDIGGYVVQFAIEVSEASKNTNRKFKLIQNSQFSLLQMSTPGAASISIASNGA